MEENSAAVLGILENQQPSEYSTTYKPNMTIPNYTHSHSINQEETETSESSKQNVIWTKNATLMLLSLYETKMHMLDNPKKKTKMWTSIAEELRSLNVEVNPDQVRWKINALTKKYKDCIESGQGPMAFKYFNEMHQILARFNDDSGTYRLASGVMQGQDNGDRNLNILNTKKNQTPFRKLRMEQRAKIELDKHWIEYLKRQEQQRMIREDRYERSLKLREEELQLRKKELEMKQSIALKRLRLKEKKHEEMLQIEREKCAILRKLLSD